MQDGVSAGCGGKDRRGVPPDIDLIMPFSDPTDVRAVAARTANVFPGSADGCPGASWPQRASIPQES
ncbi:MAG: hypothetical protein ACI4PW_05835 [Alphaproteobacteria bacterium]